MSVGENTNGTPRLEVRALKGFPWSLYANIPAHGSDMHTAPRYAEKTVKSTILTKVAWFRVTEWYKLDTTVLRDEPVNYYIIKVRRITFHVTCIIKLREPPEIVRIETKVMVYHVPET